MFAGLMGVGGQTDIVAAQIAAGTFFAFGAFLEWAFFGRDPGQQLQDALSIEPLTTNEEIFGADAGRAGSFSEAINRMFSPTTMKGYDELFGMKPKDLSGLKGSVSAIGPRSLISYADIGLDKRR